MSEVLDFEILLANVNPICCSDFVSKCSIRMNFKITMAEEDRRGHSSLYNPMNILGLKKDIEDVKNCFNEPNFGCRCERFFQIKWDEWFRLSFPSQLNVTDWEAVNVFGMNYLRQLQTVLRSVKRTTISNYQVWNVIVSAVDFLPEDYRLPYLKFQQVFTGVKVSMPRYLLFSAVI